MQGQKHPSRQNAATASKTKDSKLDESKTDRSNVTATTAKKTHQSKESSRYANSGETITETYHQNTEDRNNPIMDMESEVTQSQQSLQRKNPDVFNYLN